MKFASLAVVLAAFALPVAVGAQVVQQPPAQAQAQRGPATAQYQRWTKRLAGINLSSQQQQQVQSLLDQFAAQHPAGSPRDKAGSHALGQQIFAVLNPQQQAQLHQNIQALHQRQMQRRMQRQQMQPQPMQQPQQMQPAPQQMQPVPPQQIQPVPPVR